MTSTQPSITPQPHARPRPLLRYRVHAIRLDLHEAVKRQGRRVISALLRLSWRLEVTVGVQAEIYANDPTTAQALLEELLTKADSRLVVYTAGRRTDPQPWRTITSAPIRTLHDTTTTFENISESWIVTTYVIASVLIPAGDVDDPCRYSGINADLPDVEDPRRYSGIDPDLPWVPTPDLAPPRITFLLCWEHTHTVTPIWGRHPRRTHSNEPAHRRPIGRRPPV